MSEAAIGSIIWGLLDTFLRYRFFNKMLSNKYHCTFVWYYLGTLLYGHLNVLLVLAGTPWGNLVYLCGCSFMLNMLLFHGSILKKAFFTIWIYCVPETAYGIYFPLFYSLAGSRGQTGYSDTMLQMVEIAACLTLYIMMEVLSGNLHVLRQDFEDRDAVYLICIIVFICAAVDMMLNLFTGISGWTPKSLLMTAIPLSLTALGGEILYIYCIIMLKRRLTEQLAKQQYQMLGRHLEVSKEQYCQLIKIRHDIKNHGLCLAQLLANGKSEEAAHYLQQMNLRLEEADSIQTGSVFADALLNPKYHYAKNLGIDLTIRLSVPDEATILPVDLCCLLSNALDNAVEACQRGIEAGNPPGWIRIVSHMNPNYWVFEISNSVHSPVNLNGGKLKSSKGTAICGVGLQNIKAVVERYGGVLDLQGETQFTLSVMLPLAPKKNPSASKE